MEDDRSKNVFKNLIRKFGGGSTQYEKRSTLGNLLQLGPPPGTNYPHVITRNVSERTRGNDDNELYYSVPYNQFDCPEVSTGANYTQSEQRRDSETDSLLYESTSSTTISIQEYSYGEYCDSTWYVTDDRHGSLNTQLLDAIVNKNTAQVKRLLFDGASPNATCRATNISACHAAAYADSDALFLLLKQKAISKRKDNFGRTPLHLAAWVGNNWNVAMLLEIPEELQTKVILPMTPEDEEEVKALRPRMGSMIDVPCKIPVTNTVQTIKTSWQDSIEHKCRKYMTNTPMFFSEWTPLHIACLAAHPNTIRLLLAAGANPNSKDAVGRTPLDIAGGKIHDIDVNSYVETIKILIEHGAEVNWETASYNFDSALHIAVELCSIEAIKILLAENAPITYHNIRGNTPLHECVLKFYREPLKILANHKRRFHSYSSADVKDCSGNTVLHTAINVSWLAGVRIALEAGANITCEDKNGLTSLHLAALKGNPDILNEAINAAKYINAVIYESKKIESPLLCAIRSGNLDCVQTIIDAGAPLKVTTYFYPRRKDASFGFECPLLSLDDHNKLNMILHAAAEASNEDILKLLINQDQNIEQLLKYKCPYLLNTTPVEFAAFHNRFENFKFLLHSTVANAQASKETFDPSALLEIVATLDLDNMFIEIIKLIPTAVYITRKRGHYPLHKAIRHSKNNMILQLIKNGADLSQCDVSGQTAINLVFEHRSHPTEFISCILDCHIQTNQHSIYDPACEITVDYSVLIPTENTLKKEGQMRVLTALLKTGNAKDQRKLLAHPLVESFLYLKWKTLSTFFYTIVFIYSLFVLSLSIYILSVYYFKDRGPVPDFFNPLIWQFFILMTIYPIVIQELSCTNPASSWLSKFVSIEFWMKFATYSFALITPVIITKDSPDTEWRRHLASITLVLAWLNIMLLLSRTPMSGYYIQMFWKVSTKVIKILLIFSCLIIMFSFCFMVQFHTQHPFDGPWPALIKTLVMMTSEFEYDDTFTKHLEKNPISIQILRVVFVIFLILAAIVLMNLMIGVAVHDVQDLVLDGNLRRLEKQVEFLNNLEAPCGKKSFLKMLGLYRWFGCKKVQQTIIIKPVIKSECYYTRRIMNTIINKAQDQFDKLKKEADTKKNDTKLDEILNAVVMKEQSIIKIESKLNEAFKAVPTNKMNTVRIRSKWDKVIGAVLEKRDTQNPEKNYFSKVKNETKFEEIFKAISTKEKNMDNILTKLENTLEAITSKKSNKKYRKKENWTKTHRFFQRRNNSNK